jgi:hypothetical protein
VNARHVTLASISAICLLYRSSHADIQPTRCETQDVKIGCGCQFETNVCTQWAYLYRKPDSNVTWYVNPLPLVVPHRVDVTDAAFRDMIRTAQDVWHSANPNIIPDDDAQVVPPPYPPEVQFTVVWASRDVALANGWIADQYARASTPPTA